MIYESKLRNKTYPVGPYVTICSLW